MGLMAFDNVRWGDAKIAEFATYWRSLSRERGLPFQSSFNPAEIKHLLPGIAIYELKSDDEILCRLMGTGLAEEFGWDYTDRNFLDLWPEEVRAKVLENFQVAFTRPCGILNKFSGVTETGLEIDCHSIGFPARDGSGKAVRFVSFSNAITLHAAREPRKDKVIEVKVHSYCLINLD